MFKYFCAIHLLFGKTPVHSITGDHETYSYARYSGYINMWADTVILEMFMPQCPLISKWRQNGTSVYHEAAICSKAGGVAQ